MYKIQKKLYFIILLLISLFSKSVIAQNFNQLNSEKEVTSVKDEKVIQEVPITYRLHPEYGKTKLSNPLMQNSIELIQERTVDSRLFKNPDGSFTLVKSGEPMHYKDADGWWRTIQVAFKQNQQSPEIYYLNQQPKPIAFNAKTAQINIQLDELHNSLQYGNELTLIQLSQSGQILSKESFGNIQAKVDKVNTKALINNIFSGIDMKIDFDFSKLKSEYIISSPHLFNQEAEWITIRETVKVPEGWTFEYNKENGETIEENWQGEVVLKNKTGGIEARFIKPVYFDAGTDRNTNYIIGSYKIEHINNNTYFLYLMVPASWLLAPDRIYPVTLDPISTVDDPTIIPSCFYPNYYASTLNAAIPAGNTITNTYLLWEFTAEGNGAWLQDQMSYVSGMSGSTPVFDGMQMGLPQTGGTYQYALNSLIGNGLGQGVNSYTFYSSRLWGGSACDNIYNYLNRRRVEVTYYQPINNNVIGDMQAVCIGDIPAMLTGSTPTGCTGNYDYTWMQSTDNGQTWVNAPLPNTNINYSPGALSTTTCYKRMVQSDTCISWSNVICITMQTTIIPGTIATNQSICYNTTPALFTGTAAGCGSPPFTYQWQIQTGCTGAWSDISGATNSTLNYTTALTLSTCFRRTSIDLNDTAYSNIITITILGPFSGGTIGNNQTICYNTAPNTFVNIASPVCGTGTYTYQWQIQPNCAGVWTDITGATDDTYTHTTLIQTTCFRRVVTSGTQSENSNIIAVMVYSQLIGGTVASDQTICENSSPYPFSNVSLPSGGGGPFVYQWQQQQGCTGAWTNILGATSATYNYPSYLTQTTCFRRSVSAGNCGPEYSNIITITVNPLPLVSFSGLQNLYCINQTTPVYLTGTPAGGTFSGQGISSNLFTPSLAGIGTHQITYTYVDGNGCSDSSTTTVTVDPCTGLEAVLVEKIRIYPNPVSGILFVETNVLTDDFIISLFDIHGLLIEKLKTTGTKTKINISGLADGMYFIRLENDKRVIIKRFIKNTVP